MAHCWMRQACPWRAALGTCMHACQLMTGIGLSDGTMHPRMATQLSAPLQELAVCHSMLAQRTANTSSMH